MRLVAAADEDSCARLATCEISFFRPFALLALAGFPYFLAAPEVSGMNVYHRSTRLLVISAVLVISFASAAQPPSPRIRGPIEARPSVSLPGSVDPHIRDAEDLGPLPADVTIPGITLVLSRSPQQQAALDQLLVEQTNPSSPLFHQWLTPDQFATRFGPAPADVASVERWLQDRGFTLEGTADNSGRISFSGTASQVHEAFGAELHRFRRGEELHLAPAGALSLPAALAPVTSAVLHLSDFRPKPNVRAQPNYTAASEQSHFLSAADALTMYDFGPLSSAKYGTNQSFAVVGQSYVGANGLWEIGAFLNASSSNAPITPVLVPGSGVEAILPGDEGESEIDLEYSMSVVRGGNAYFVFTGSNLTYDVWDALAFAITRNIAPVISVSYGECEPLLSPRLVQQFDGLFQEAAAQGQTIVAASGDQGPTTCTVYGSSSGLTSAQLEGLAVSFPGSSPFVTAVGGTQMAPGTFTAGPSPYWKPATTSDVTSSLLGYVPEVAWNEDSSAALIASTGGASILYSRPSWQAGVPGIPAGTARLVPDISFEASVGNPGYVVCTDDPALGGDISDCVGTGFRNSSGNYIVSGGTSFTAPMFAGFVTALNGYERSNGQGNVNPVLYNIASQPALYASVFHDIMVGTTACLSGQPECGAAGQSGFAATVGYDQATGLGSLDFAKLLAAWPASPSKNLIPTLLRPVNAPSRANPGDSFVLTIYVDETSSTGAPAASGSVSILLDGGSPVSLPLTSVNYDGVATYSFTAPASTGSHIVSLVYPGDSTHSGSSATISVMVGSPTPTGSISLSATNLSLSANGTGSTQVTITPSGGYNGALTWTSKYSGTVSQTICYYLSIPRVVSGTTLATLHMGVGTACNSPAGGHLLQGSPVQHTAVDRSSSRLLQYVSGTAATPVLGVLVFGLLPWRRRRPLPVLAVLLLSMVPIALSGCGGGSASASGSGVSQGGGATGGGATGGGATGAGGGAVATPEAQVYTITLTAVDSVQTSITASTSFTLTVN